jgi:hypothetical protein
MKTICSLETPVDFQWTSGSYIPKIELFITNSVKTLNPTEISYVNEEGAAVAVEE